MCIDIRSGGMSGGGIVCSERFRTAGFIWWAVGGVNCWRLGMPALNLQYWAIDDVTNWRWMRL